MHVVLSNVFGYELYEDCKFLVGIASDRFAARPPCRPAEAAGHQVGPGLGAGTRVVWRALLHYTASDGQP